MLNRIAGIVGWIGTALVAVWCALAVDGATSATAASSVAVRAWPSIRQLSMRARAGSAMAPARRAKWKSAFDGEDGEDVSMRRS